MKTHCNQKKKKNTQVKINKNFLKKLFKEFVICTDVHRFKDLQEEQQGQAPSSLTGKKHWAVGRDTLVQKYQQGNAKDTE